MGFNLNEVSPNLSGVEGFSNAGCTLWLKLNLRALLDGISGWLCLFLKGWNSTSLSALEN